MAIYQIPDAIELRQLVDYDPDSGTLTWRPRPDKRWSNKWQGRPALSGKDRKGYLRGSIGDSDVFAHRAAFCWMTGRWPDQIDHINGDPADNRWTNLREVSRADQQKNLRRFKNNKSGHTGVFFNKRTGRWVATLGRRILGQFIEKGAAIQARQRALAEDGTYHPNHGAR